MSVGSRSGVNCTRLKSPANSFASAFASVVLPTPGTSSISTWLPESSATARWSMTSAFPRITRLNCVVIAGTCACSRESIIGFQRAPLLPYREGHRRDVLVPHHHQLAAGVGHVGEAPRQLLGRHRGPGHRHLRADDVLVRLVLVRAPDLVVVVRVVPLLRDDRRDDERP